MKTRSSYIAGFLILCFLFIMVLPLNVSAADSISGDWEKGYTNVPIDKTWTVSFSHEINRNTVNNDTVYVTDQNGGKLHRQDFDYPADNKLLSLKPPKGGYTPGGEYYLNITAGVESASGKPLNHPVSMHFITATEENNQVDKEVVSAVLTGLDSALGPLFEDQGTITPTKLQEIIEQTPGVNLLAVEKEVAVAEIGKNGPLMFISTGKPEPLFDPGPGFDEDLDYDEKPASSQTLSYAGIQTPRLSGEHFPIPLANGQQKVPHKSIPKGKNVLLLSAFSDIGVYKNINPDISRIIRNVRSCDYSVSAKDASIQNLKAVRDVAVLLFKTHGEKFAYTLPDLSAEAIPTYCLASSTLVDKTDPFPAHLNVDLLLRRVVFMYEHIGVKKANGFMGLPASL